MNTLTVPKIKDLVNKPSEQYKNMFSSFNNVSSLNANSNNNSNNNSNSNTNNDNNMNDELSSFLNDLTHNGPVKEESGVFLPANEDINGLESGFSYY